MGTLLFPTRYKLFTVVCIYYSLNILASLTQVAMQNVNPPPPLSHFPHLPHLWEICDNPAFL